MDFQFQHLFYFYFIFFKKKFYVKNFLLEKKAFIQKNIRQNITNSFNTEKNTTDHEYSRNSYPSEFFNQSERKYPNVQQDSLFPICIIDQSRILNFKIPKFQKIANNIII